MFMLISGPEDVAAMLKKQLRNMTSADGYSFIPVHVWSHTVADVATCVMQG